jgi:hypothetical protein
MESRAGIAKFASARGFSKLVKGALRWSMNVEKRVLEIEFSELGSI